VSDHRRPTGWIRGPPFQSAPVQSAQLSWLDRHALPRPARAAAKAEPAEGPGELAGRSNCAVQEPASQRFAREAHWRHRAQDYERLLRPALDPPHGAPHGTDPLLFERLADAPAR